MRSNQQENNEHELSARKISNGVFGSAGVYC